MQHKNLFTMLHLPALNSRHWIPGAHFDLTQRDAAKLLSRQLKKRTRILLEE